jgi:hypothetical protein
MDYPAIRHEIRTGDLLFWSHGSWSSWADIQTLAVRAFTMSEYSHVGVAVVLAGRVFVVHAIGRGVVIEPLSNQDAFYWCPMGHDFPESALDAGMRRVGESYSKWQAVLAFFQKLRIGADTQWQCAEFALWFWQQAGIVIGDTATPAALARQMNALGKPLHWVKI